MQTSENPEKQQENRDFVPEARAFATLTGARTIHSAPRPSGLLLSAEGADDFDFGVGHEGLLSA